MLPCDRTLPQHKNWIQITQKYFDGAPQILTSAVKLQQAMDVAAKKIENLLK